MGLVTNKLVLTNQTLAGHRGQPRWQGQREGEKAPVNTLALTYLPPTLSFHYHQYNTRIVN